ncbi:MAG: tRNA (guanosine(37)-N1)-methyltransferase TrmD [Clostridiales bacterium]|nr:tRNA (guanosine(37)-N1)-methyltransferase TrmD [Clostridiales bacterium]
MNFHVLTLFPEMVEAGIKTSITGRAIENGLISLNAVNIRDYSEDKHKRVDDYPYGGGAGMVIQAEPVYKAYGYLVNHIKMAKEDQSTFKKPRVIYVTPQGRVFNQNMANELSQEEDLIFLCGHYEGIDERVLEMIVTDNISIGDYILTGGELPAMVMIDAIARLVPGVLNNEASSEFETFKDNLLEYPQYTRPEVFMGRKVPEVLLSGHHAKIDTYRRQESITRTYDRRPDLLENATLTEEEREFLTRMIFQKNYDVYS